MLTFWRDTTAIFLPPASSLSTFRLASSSPLSCSSITRCGGGRVDRIVMMVETGTMVPSPRREKTRPYTPQWSSETWEWCDKPYRVYGITVPAPPVYMNLGMYSLAKVCKSHFLHSHRPWDLWSSLETIWRHNVCRERCSWTSKVWYTDVDSRYPLGRDCCLRKNPMKFRKTCSECSWFWRLSLGMVSSPTFAVQGLSCERSIEDIRRRDHTKPRNSWEALCEIFSKTDVLVD